MRLSPARQQGQRQPYFCANVVSDKSSEYVDNDDASAFYSCTATVSTPSINATTNTRFSDSQQQRGQSRGQHRGQLRTDQHRGGNEQH